jgi:hypothetical protein
MPPETHFRIALAVLILLSMSIAAYHRLRAASSGD